MNKLLIAIIFIFGLVGCKRDESYVETSANSTIDSANVVDTDFSEAFGSIGEDLPIGGFYDGVEFYNFLLGGPGGIRTLIPAIPAEQLTPAIIFYAGVTDFEIFARSIVPVKIVGYLNGVKVIEMSTIGSSDMSPPGKYFSFHNVSIDRVDFDVPDEYRNADRLQRILVIDYIKVRG